MKRCTLLLLPILAIGLCSCADFSMSPQNGEQGGAGGALRSSTVGRNTEATLTGSAVGTLLSYIVDKEMERYDRRELNQAYEFGPSGRTTGWQNPDTGKYFQLIPQAVYTQPQLPDRPCRRAEILATIDGRTEKTYTTACRNSAGQWELQN